MAKQKTVLLLQSSFCQSNVREYEAIVRRARELGFRVQAVQYGKAAFNHYKEACTFDGGWVRDTLRFWRPDGCIVESGSFDCVLDPADFGRLPTVFLDRNPSTVGKDVVCISSDAESIAIEAARELLRLSVGHYAYFPFNIPVAWSDERERAFVRVMRERGVSPIICRVKSVGTHAAVEFERQVLSLPRPCGVFAANDVVAEQIAEVCARHDIAVPDEVAIVGVDNDEQICENAHVTISSIAQDYAGAGILAVNCLAERFMHPRRKPSTPSFGALGVVRRASTRIVCHDRRIQTGLECIRRQACGKLSVSDVVAAMGCSRRLAYLRFAQHVGHSIAEEISAVRIERACTLLRQGELAVSAIADACGFSSDIVFRRVFKVVTGHTPTAWKRADAIAR